MGIAGAVGATLLLCAACFGSGAAVITLLGLPPNMHRSEQAIASFSVGLGAIGWAAFFVGVSGGASPMPLFVLCLVGCGGLVLLARADAVSPSRSRATEAAGATTWLLLGLIAVALCGSLMVALAPPADADSLAYHFALPKQFLAAGRIEFVPRAVTGTAPLLLQMTYMVALALGGETAMTLWTMLTGWMAGALVYLVARRFLGRDWSLALTLLFLTTPAVVYGAGSGQVEVRAAIFAVGAALATAAALRTNRIGYAGLAGLFAGFFAAAKFTGLLYAAICGIVLLFRKGWPGRALAFGIALSIAGSQWYVWNWIHTGDPTFPVLFHVLGLPDSAIWTQAMEDWFRAHYYAAESPIPVDLFHFVTYPFRAAFGEPAAIEAARTGLGPVSVMVFPFAIGGAWHYRRRIAASPLAIPVLIAFGFYAVWFASGTSQRLRHLLPIYPLLLIALIVVAARWSERTSRQRPLIAAITVAVAVQLGGQAVFAANYARYLVSGESRDSFLARNIGPYAPVRWINSHLTAQDRVLYTDNELGYLIDVPAYYAHADFQLLVDLRPQANDAGRFLGQLRSLGITHILVTTGIDPAENAFRQTPNPGSLQRLSHDLVAASCARIVATFPITRIASRTLRNLGLKPVTSEYGAVLALTRQGCRL